MYGSGICSDRCNADLHYWIGAPMKLRFALQTDSDGECYYNILARRKSTGKWECIGTCHIAARDAVKAGQLELIQLLR